MTTVHTKEGLEIIRNDDDTVTYVDHARGVRRTFKSHQELLDDDMFGEFSNYGRDWDLGIRGWAMLVIAMGVIGFLVIQVLPS